MSHDDPDPAEDPIDPRDDDADDDDDHELERRRLLATLFAGFGA
jgi:hypothetical protein